MLITLGLCHLFVGLGGAFGRSVIDPRIRDENGYSIHDPDLVSHSYWVDMWSLFLVWELVLPIWGTRRLLRTARKLGARKLLAKQALEEAERNAERELQRAEAQERETAALLARQIDALPQLRAQAEARARQEQWKAQAALAAATELAAGKYRIDTIDLPAEIQRIYQDPPVRHFPRGWTPYDP